MILPSLPFGFLLVSTSAHLALLYCLLSWLIIKAASSAVVLLFNFHQIHVGSINKAVQTRGMIDNASNPSRSEGVFDCPSFITIIGKGKSIYFAIYCLIRALLQK